MATTDTKTMIEGAAGRFLDQVPALKKLGIVVRLDLRERGGIAVWRLELPAIEAKRDPAADAKIEIEMDRRAFTQLSEKAKLGDWVAAHERGIVRVTGDPTAVKLLQRVMELRLARSK